MAKELPAARPNAILGALRHDNAFADAVLVVGNTETPVHRAVLSQLSPFFKTIFQQCAKNGTNGVPRITLQHASRSSVAVLVDFAYGLDVVCACGTSLDTALDVANLAATLGIRELCAIATRATLRLVRAPDYARVFYALRLFGRDDDARGLISLAARDPTFWCIPNALERFSAPDVETLLKSPDVVATEDDLLRALVLWVSVDPAQRERVFVDRFLSTIKAQRLTARSAEMIKKLTTIVPPSSLTAMLVGATSRAIAPPPGTDLGSSASVARARGGANVHPFLGAPLDWMTMGGRDAFTNRDVRHYPVPIVCAQHFVVTMHGLSAESLRDGINRWFYIDFVSLCIRLQVSLNERSFLAEPTIERRNRADVTPDEQVPSLAEALEPLAIIIETAVSFVHGTPLQNAFSVWRAVDLAPMAQPYMRTAAPASSPAIKRRRTAVTARRIHLVDDARRKSIVDAVSKRDCDAIDFVFCFRTTKMSLLRSHGFLAGEDISPTVAPPPLTLS